MSDIFLSYAKEDRDQARVLAEALSGLGWSVFWDRNVPAGLTWREFIGKELQEARSVVVAWSEASVDSQWVLEEAEQAKKKGILIPVLIQPVDPPLGFGSLQAADLSNWDGSGDAPALLKMVDDMARVLGAPPGSIEEETHQEHGQAEDLEPEGGKSMASQKHAGSLLWVGAVAVVLALALVWAFLRIAALEQIRPQSGRESFTEAQLREGSGEQTATRNVTFPRAYSEPPEVLVVLSAIDSSKDANTRLVVDKEKITKTGFTITVKVWDDSKVYQADASWIALGKPAP